MNFFKALTLIVFLFGCSSKSKIPKGSDLGTWDPKVLEKENGVIIIPQWHLAPETDTKNIKGDLPQSINQTSIYKELSNWIVDKYVDTVIIEGCENKNEFEKSMKFNGWTLNDLLQTPSIEEVQTHIGLKLKARFKDNIYIECGDNLALIKENQLALSEIRGLTGFKLRIEQQDLSPTIRKKYVESAKAVLHLSSEKNEKDVLAQIKLNLEKEIEIFETIIKKRNDSFINKTNEIKGRKVILIGLIHLNDMKKKLSNLNIPYSTWIPTGLDHAEKDLLSRLKASN